MREFVKCEENRGDKVIDRGDAFAGLGSCYLAAVRLRNGCNISLFCYLSRGGEQHNFSIDPR